MAGVILPVASLAFGQGVCNHWTLDSRKSQRLALVFHQVCHLWACFGLDWYRFWYCPRNSVNYVSFYFVLRIDQWKNTSEMWNQRIWQISPFFISLSKNVSNSTWFPMKLLELNVNRKSRHSTGVKRESVKCWKFILSVNFPWLLIHWPFTSSYLQTFTLTRVTKLP